jgi:hypothetical protein
VKISILHLQVVAVCMSRTEDPMPMPPVCTATTYLLSPLMSVNCETSRSTDTQYLPSALAVST